MSLSAPTNSAASILQRYQSVSVLVIGDAILDVRIEGSVSRISPEAPVPILHHTHQTYYLGGAANVAANLASIGVTAELIAHVGEDSNAQRVRDLLDIAGIVDDVFQSPAVPTITKTRLVSSNQQLVRIDQERELTTDQHHAHVMAKARAFLARHSGSGCAVILADYAKGFLSAGLVKELISACRHVGVPVVCDPKSTDVERYGGCTIVKPNIDEALAATSAARQGAGGADPKALLQAYLRRSGAENVVLSMSGRGILVGGSLVQHFVDFEAEVREVADVSGAGDTLVALLAAGLAADRSLTDAARVANLAAGAVCEKPGTSTLDPIEFLRVVRRASFEAGSANPKILDGMRDAAFVGERFRLTGRRLVFTNGCFDLLHAGHIHLLQEARRSGDALLVALNSDTSVRELKGMGRPAQSEFDRIQIIAALECVDFVVLFESTTPLELIRIVRPSVLVKGDDYEESEIVGALDVRSWGGDVRRVARVEGRSTSAILSSLGANIRRRPR